MSTVLGKWFKSPAPLTPEELAEAREIGRRQFAALAELEALGASPKQSPDLSSSELPVLESVPKHQGSETQPHNSQ